VLAAVFPISFLGDLFSLGTALAFVIVCLSLMWLRTTRPDLHRPFRVPFGGFHIGKAWIGYVPVAAIVMCIGMVLPVAFDIFAQARRGDIMPDVDPRRVRADRRGDLRRLWISGAIAAPLPSSRSNRSPDPREVVIDLDQLRWQQSWILRRNIAVRYCTAI